MNSAPDPLEKALHQALRSLPNQKAPATLENRVLAELARRQAATGPSRSWASWPAPMRWAFLIVSAGICGLAVAVGMMLFRDGGHDLLHSLAGEPVQRLLTFRDALRGATSAGSDLFSLIPQTWLYAALGGFFLVYGVLFGIGATAYRTLWKTR